MGEFEQLQLIKLMEPQTETAIGLVFFPLLLCSVKRVISLSNRSTVKRNRLHDWGLELLIFCWNY